MKITKNQKDREKRECEEIKKAIEIFKSLSEEDKRKFLDFAKKSIGS